jgi:alpha-L-fucosidase
MDHSRRDFLQKGAFAAAGLAFGNLLDRNVMGQSLVTGPFKPTDESLKKYQCPDWFRDAKFGIWAVWGPESVPQQGDWYARHMYEEGSSYYKYHLEHYGHPSKFGFKDIIPLWKAENWEPERLMERYKKAGAKYFCMIAQHHDNFDCFNSRYHKKWNAVNMGPKRDIAAEWQAAAKKNGLHFGMTEHLAASWWFYGASKQADKLGPMKDVPYDGNDPGYSDLYWKGNKYVDKYGRYYIPNAPDFVQKIWYNRISSIIDTYHPDLLYSDSPLPFPDEYGRRLVSNYYNDNIKKHQGRLEGVYTCKEESFGKWVQDVERGVKNDIIPDPWQTDTCVADWYYKRSVFENHQYKSPQTIIHMLADIVSKNGNLLLNFPPKPDGTLDDDELKILDELAKWMPVNGEAIFSTRPWKIYGEGAAPVKDLAFNEDSLKYASNEVRFTTKGNLLYIISLGWPQNGQVNIKSLSRSTGEIERISLLGHKGLIEWKQNSDGLLIYLPNEKPCDYACSFKVEGLKINTDN